VRGWPKRERVTTEVTAPLVAMLRPALGERILEVGSGGGLAAIEVARAVGASGTVTGLDISAGMVGLATRRAAEAGVRNARFVAGDAQVDDIPGAPFDAATSQFGIMFFSDPVAAFKNIRRHLRPGGRLAFACWQPVAKNSWFPGTVLAKYATAQPPTGGGGVRAPGPFAFGDAAYVTTVLTDAGFVGVKHEEMERDVVLPEDSMYDRGIVDLMELDAVRAEEAWQELMSLVVPMRTGDGDVRVHIAFQFFVAGNPS
jgi:SAM-dependent methyltransferase